MLNACCSCVPLHDFLVSLAQLELSKRHLNGQRGVRRGHRRGDDLIARADAKRPKQQRDGVRAGADTD